MNNQAEQVLTHLLQRAVDGVDKAVEFSQAQIPDVVEQLLAWKVAEASMWLIVGLILIGCVVFLWVAQYREHGNFNLVESDSFGTALATMTVAPVGLLAVALSSMQIAKILIAPKLYLLEYAAELVK